MIRSLVFLAILLSLILPFSALCQKISWGPEYEKENAIIEIIGSDGGHFYALSNSKEKDEYLILKFSLSGKLVSEKPIKITAGSSKDIGYINVLHTAEHDYVVFVNRDKKQDKSSFYFTEIKNGEPTPLTKSFHAFPFAYTYGSGLGPAVAYDEEAKSGSYRISPDKKTLVTFGSDIGHYADQIIEVVVFNEKLEPTWKNKHTIPVPNRQVEVVELVVNNSGEVFVLVKKWEKLNDRYMGDKPLEYTLYAITAAGVKEHKFKLGKNEEPVRLSLQIGKQGQVAILGTYRTLDMKSEYTLGTFFAHINASGTLTAKAFPYTAEVLTALSYTPTEAKNNALSVVDMHEVDVLPNGNFYFTAAKYYDVSSSSSTTSITTYMGQMLVSFTPNGESVKIDYLLQPLKLKNLFRPGYSYSYQKDNGVVFVANYVKLSLEDKGLGKAHIYTSVCYLEPGQPKECTDIYNNPDTDNLIYPRYWLELKDGRHIVLRGTGYSGNIYSFGIY